MLTYVVIDTGEFFTSEMIQTELNRLADLGYRVDHIIPAVFKGDDFNTFDTRIILRHDGTPPDGLEHIRELDLEIHELIEAGLIERKDCGYALTEQQETFNNQ